MSCSVNFVPKCPSKTKKPKKGTDRVTTVNTQKLKQQEPKLLDFKLLLASHSSSSPSRKPTYRTDRVGFILRRYSGPHAVQVADALSGYSRRRWLSGFHNFK